MKGKPADLKYTELCMYIDDVLYYRDKDNNPIGQKELSPKQVETVYTYLYHLTYALAVKKRLFTNLSDYDAFCTEAAGRFFQRLTKPGQDFTYQSARNNNPIKSVLNYVKGAIGFMAISYRQENYSQVFNAEHNSEEEMYGIKSYVEGGVLNEYKTRANEDIADSFNSIDTYVSKTLDSSIYGKNAKKRHNLEYSFYLSVLNLLTLPKAADNLELKKRINKILKQFQDKEKYIIQWEEDDITPQIIDMYIKKVFAMIEEDMDDIRDSYRLDDDILTAIISSALPTYGMDQSEDN